LPVTPAPAQVPPGGVPLSVYGGSEGQISGIGLMVIAGRVVDGNGQSCCIRTLTGVGREGISCSGIGVEGRRPRARNTFIGGICQRIRPSGALGRDGVEGWCSDWSNGDGQSCCIRTLTGVGCEGISRSGIGVEGWRPRARNTFIGSVSQRIRPSGALRRDGD
jgi:hypothetical protein